MRILTGPALTRGVPAILRRPAAGAAAVALAYLAVARASVLFSFQSGQITPIFPAAGIALAAALVLGRPGLLGVWLGALLNLLLTLAAITDVPFPAAPSILLVGLAGSLGAAAGAGAGSFLVRRACPGRHPLDSAHDVARLVLLGVLCAAISPTTGVLGMWAGGYLPWHGLGLSWLTWWVGDASGTVLAAPLVLALFHRRRAGTLRRPGGPRRLEALALAGTIAAFSWTVFFSGWLLPYGLIPLLLWAAVRFGMLGACAAGVAAALLGTLGTSLGLGPFVRAAPAQSLLVLQGYFGATMFCTLFIAAILQERETMEEALREGQAKFRAVVENSREGISFLDAEAVILYRSPSAGTITGYTAEEQLGRNGFAMVHPDDMAAVRRAWALLLAQPETEQQVQFRIRHKDGSLRWVAGSARNLLANLEVQAVIVTLADITAAKLAELELEQSRANLSSVIESTTDLIWSVDKHYRLVVWNTGYAEHIRRCYGREARFGETHFDRLPPERAARWTPLYDRAIAEGPFQLEYAIPDGRTLELSFHPTRSGGEVMGVSVFGKDVTAHRSAEAMVRKVSTAVAQSQAAIIITDTRGVIEYVNPRFVEVTGHSAEEALGRDPSLLKSGDQPAAFYEELWETISAGHVWHGEFRNRRKDGGLFWERATISPIKDDLGVITGYVAIKDDITGHKRAEAEHAKLQAQLLQAQKLESVGRLAGGVAHDFNNMLCVILTNAELALAQLGPGHPGCEKLEQVRKAALRSADLTRQLLAFARQQPVVPRVLDLNHAIEGILRMLRRIIGEDIAIGWIPGVRLWRTVMDPTQLDQILANLLVNARDAIRGEGKVTITTQNVHVDPAFSSMQMGTKAGDFVLLTVSDDGCGMDVDTLGKIFEPFYTTKGVGQGTGLGLSTVYGVVQQNDGFINVYSEPRLGTTFKVYLPRHLGAEDEAGFPTEEATLTRGSETVVLVEDNGVLLHSIGAVLGALGYHVLPVAEPLEAIRLAQDYPGPLHLLLTDVVMPGMSGRDLVLAFQSVRPETKCLYMSGYAADIISRQGILHEGLQFIQKPFSSLEIAKRLRSVLEA